MFRIALESGLPPVSTQTCRQISRAAIAAYPAAFHAQAWKRVSHFSCLSALHAFVLRVDRSLLRALKRCARGIRVASQIP